MSRLVDISPYENCRIVLHPEDTGFKVSELPTVDAVEVVRCKECKNHEDEEPGMVYCPHVIGGWVNEMGFCADGERKEGNR